MDNVRNIAKSTLRRLIRASGYDFVKWHPVPPAVGARKRLLDSFGIDVVLDVGANAGQFAMSLRDPMGYRGTIISLEPLPDAYEQLRRLTENDPAWQAHNVALGDADGRLTLHVSRNRVSSSFLPIRETSTAVEPHSAYEAQCVVPVRTLDSLLPELPAITSDSRIMLKLDTQGFESRILAGAKQSMDRFALVQMEMSLVSLYEGEVLFLDMCTAMRDSGFDLIALDPGFQDVASGRLLQVDGVFCRSASARGTRKPA